jgi:GT2 family glycosyltransferase
VVDRAASDANAPLIRYVHQAHSGVNSARNRVIHAAHGDIIILFDDDEEAPPEWLSKMAGALARHPEAGAVGGPYFRKGPGPLPRTCPRCSLDEGTMDLGGDEREVPMTGGGNLAIRRWAFERVGEFDTRLSGWGDEVEWQERLQAAAIPLVYSPEPWAWHIRSAADASPLRLCHKAFSREREASRHRTILGTPSPRAESLARIPRLLTHALLARCWWGIVASAGCAGKAMGR